jgi:hypothetical protein
MKDEELKLEEIEASHTLGGLPDSVTFFLRSYPLRSQPFVISETPFWNHFTSGKMRETLFWKPFYFWIHK